MKKTIVEFLIQDDYINCQYSVQRDGTSALQRLMDWLERFVVANEELIRDHETKVKVGKKTRRVKPDSLFREAT